MMKRMKMGRLILALGILTFSALTIHVAAQRRSRVPIGPGPIEVFVPFVDLLPLPAPGTSGSAIDFCFGDPPGQGNLTVRVHNRGNDGAPASHVKVVFVVPLRPNKAFTKSVAGIPAGGTQTATFAIPTSCRPEECGFTITVDSQNEVKEKVETNNIAKGTCLG